MNYDIGINAKETNQKHAHKWFSGIDLHFKQTCDLDMNQWQTDKIKTNTIPNDIQYPTQNKQNQVQLSFTGANFRVLSKILPYNKAALLLV